MKKGMDIQDIQVQGVLKIFILRFLMVSSCRRQQLANGLRLQITTIITQTVKTIHHNERDNLFVH